MKDRAQKQNLQGKKEYELVGSCGWDILICGGYKNMTGCTVQTELGTNEGLRIIGGKTMLELIIFNILKLESVRFRINAVQGCERTSQK